ncbi:E3 ubiquitin-protein ligase RING1-like [Pyrus communis]|uniref:E3 ubiquitin-protein ligase RING1-like n=1 Tax=Pyrus communis TaxID=23211 RepID=UPI0035BF77F5
MEATLEQLTNDDNSNKGMVPASYPAINKVLKRVRVGSTSADDEESSLHDDVEEEGRERKRRKIRVRESESCTVCMEFKGGSTVVYMPCFHVFHGRCIVKWLRVTIVRTNTGVKEEGTRSKGRRTSASDDVKDEGCKEKRRGISVSETDSCIVSVWKHLKGHREATENFGCIYKI